MKTVELTTTELLNIDGGTNIGDIVKDGTTGPRNPYVR